LQMVTTICSVVVYLEGESMRRGERTYLLLAAANRDPAVFHDPDALILHRRPNNHLAFSDGRHACLGANLARITTQEIIGALIELVPRLRSDAGAVTWHHRMLSRGLRILPVELSDC
jgi:cytochrome P450